MHRLPLLLIASLSAAPAVASGVGASYYVAGKATPPVVQASCETCGPVAACPSCGPIGFAGVDHTTPAPCTAEGGCYPARDSFGFYAQRWRRWPGTEDYDSAPEIATEDDTLPPFDPPPAEEEDQRAPPPIEDVESTDDSADEGFDPGQPDAGRGLEITLPPLPDEGGAAPRPAPPRFREGPPELPFGFAPPQKRPRPEPKMIDAGRWRVPPPPFSTTSSRRVDASVLPASAPPLPPSFSGGATRRDSAVRAASATERLPEWRR